MRQSRLQEEQEKLAELVKYAHLLGEEDRQKIAKLGAKAWDEVLDVDYNNLFLPQSDFERENAGASIVRVFRDPAHIYLATKHLFNIELHPMQIAILQQIEKYKYPMFVASRGAGKSFLLAIYALWTCLFKQGSKVVVTGSGFRQAKIIFNYMYSIWRGAPILRDIVGSGKHAGPKFNVDECRFHIGDSTTVAIPVGDGCVISSSQITTYNKFSTIGNLFNLERVDTTDESSFITVDSSNGFKRTDAKRYNGLKATKVVTTKKGYNIEGTLNHKIKVITQNGQEWKRFDEMVIGDRILVYRKSRWHKGVFNCTYDEAYSLGLMIGDGSWCNDYHLRFATLDKELINYLVDGTHLKWKQCGDGVHYNIYGKDCIELWKDWWQIKNEKTIDKCLPETILGASKEAMSACLSGLFDTDGHVQVSTAKGGTSVSVNFTNTSKKLVEQIQYILLHYGIVSCLRFRDRNKKWNRVYELGIYGNNVQKFADQINFRLKRKRLILETALVAKRRMTSQEEIPYAKEIMLQICNDINLGQIFSKSNLDLRKVITFEYCQKFISRVEEKGGHPLLAKLIELCNTDYFYDSVESITNSEAYTYDIHVPEGNEYICNGFVSHNSKIRGLRASVLLNDEFAALSEQVYEEVISGFMSVTSDPINNVKREASVDVLKILHMWDDSLSEDKSFGNQSVLSGTADYAFKHFCKYWKQYKSIILSKGDKSKVDISDESKLQMNYRNYMIVRLPFNLVPKGFMDEEHIARSQTISNTAIHLQEYGAVFVQDSNGFFKRSTIEGCTVADNNPIYLPSCGKVLFDVALAGHRERKYIISIDPASEIDNFAICVIECWPDHRRLVYCWTITKKKHRNLLSKGLTQEKDFYAFCARKIRDLRKIFPCDRIVMDSQGGGFGIYEALHNDKMLQDGELPIWEIIDDDKEKETDNYEGEHILEMVKFADAEWVYNANHFLKKDMQDKTLLFPRCDPAAVALAIERDKMSGRISVESNFDEEYAITETSEDIIFEIEEMKVEISIIEHSTTENGRDKWDTPEIKIPGAKKGRVRKDRYTALLMGNMTARTVQGVRVVPEPEQIGLAVAELKNQRHNFTDTADGLYSGPAWYIDDVGGMAVSDDSLYGVPLY